MKVTCFQAVEPAQTSGLKRRRRGLLSPSSSTDSLHENVTHACAVVIQRKWRAHQKQRSRLSLHSSNTAHEQQGAQVPCTPPTDVATPPQSAATTWVTTVAGLLAGGLSADAALALDDPEVRPRSGS